jgi:hypothetical protein
MACQKLMHGIKLIMNWKMNIEIKWCGNMAVWSSICYVGHRWIFCVVLLCAFAFWLPSFNVRYDFGIKPMFGSSLLPVVCRGFVSYLHYLRIVVSNRYCVVLLVCVSSSCVPYVASFSGLPIIDCRYSLTFNYYLQPRCGQFELQVAGVAADLV